jgi:uncharacterized membrane protein YhaH (DUF805 family)
MLVLLGSLGATLLAFRFNVIILLPAILLGWMVALVNGVVTASPDASIAYQMALVAVALQLGYMAGIVLKWAMLASRRHHESGKSALVPDGTF